MSVLGWTLSGPTDVIDSLPVEVTVGFVMASDHESSEKVLGNGYC